MMRGLRQELLKLPLTEEQRDRLVDLYAGGPLQRKPIDSELETIGWVGKYDSFDEKDDSVEVKQEARWFYDKNGSVHSWLYKAN